MEHPEIPMLKRATLSFEKHPTSSLTDASFPWPPSLLVHLVAGWNGGFATAWDSLKSLNLPFLRPFSVPVVDSPLSHP
jgi:hypothetical protein